MKALRQLSPSPSFSLNTTCRTTNHTSCTNILLAGGSLKHAGAMIGHKDLRMTNRYTNLEGLVDNPVQGMLADHYENGQNQKRTHLGHKAPFRPKTTKKGSQAKT